MIFKNSACSVAVVKSLWKIRSQEEGTITIEVKKKIGYESRMCRYWLSSSWYRWPTIPAIFLAFILRLL